LVSPYVNTYRKTNKRLSVAIGKWSEDQEFMPAGTPGHGVNANRAHSGLGATFQLTVSRQLYESNSTISCGGGLPISREICLLPGHATPGIYLAHFGRAHDEHHSRFSAGTRPARTLIVSAPYLMAGLLAFPHRLDGLGPFASRLSGRDSIVFARARPVTGEEPKWGHLLAMVNR